MLVAVQSFGSIWTVRRAGTKATEASSGRGRAFFNTTGVLTGTKFHNRSYVYGYVRVDECSGFDAARAQQAIRRVYETEGVVVWEGRNKLFLRYLTASGTRPDVHLFRIATSDIGWIDRTGAWNCDGAALISFSEGNGQQELLVLLPAFGWIRGAHGTFCAEPLCETPWVARLSYAGSRETRCAI